MNHASLRAQFFPQNPARTMHDGRRYKDPSIGSPDTYHAYHNAPMSPATGDRMKSNEKDPHWSHGNDSDRYFHGHLDDQHSEQMFQKSNATERMFKSRDLSASVSLSLSSELRRPRIIPDYNKTLPRCNQCHRIRKQVPGPPRRNMSASTTKGNDTNIHDRPESVRIATNRQTNRDDQTDSRSRRRLAKENPYEAVPMTLVRRKHSPDLHRNLQGNLSKHNQSQGKVLHSDKELPTEENLAFSQDDENRHALEERLTHADRRSIRNSDHTQNNRTEKMPNRGGKTMVQSHRILDQHEHQPIRSHNNIPVSANSSHNSSTKSHDKMATAGEPEMDTITHSHKDPQPIETRESAISSRPSTSNGKTHLENNTVLNIEDTPALANSHTDEATAPTVNPKEVLPPHDIIPANEISNSDNVPVWDSFLAKAGKMFGIKKVGDNNELEKPSKTDDDAVENPGSPVGNVSETRSSMVDAPRGSEQPAAVHASSNEQTQRQLPKNQSEEQQLGKTNKMTNTKTEPNPTENSKTGDETSNSDNVPMWDSFLTTAGKMFGIKKVSDNKELEKHSVADDDASGRPISSPEHGNSFEESHRQMPTTQSAEKKLEQINETSSSTTTAKAEPNPAENKTADNEIPNSDNVPVWDSFLATAGKIFGKKKVSDNEELEKPSQVDDDRIDKPNSLIKTSSETSSSSSIIDAPEVPSPSPLEQPPTEGQNHGQMMSEKQSADTQPETINETIETTDANAETNSAENSKKPDCVIS